LSVYLSFFFRIKPCGGFVPETNRFEANLLATHGHDVVFIFFWFFFVVFFGPPLFSGFRFRKPLQIGSFGFDMCSMKPIKNTFFYSPQSAKLNQNQIIFSVFNFLKHTLCFAALLCFFPALSIPPPASCLCVEPAPSASPARPGRAAGKGQRCPPLCMGPPAGPRSHGQPQEKEPQKNRRGSSNGSNLPIYNAQPKSGFKFGWSPLDRYCRVALCLVTRRAFLNCTFLTPLPSDVRGPISQMAFYAISSDLPPNSYTSPPQGVVVVVVWWRGGESPDPPSPPLIRRGVVGPLPTLPFLSNPVLPPRGEEVARGGGL